MKKLVLRSFAFATVVAGCISTSVFAQDAAAPAANADAGKFTPSMSVQARYILSDSTRKTGFDFMSQQLRLGGKYTLGAFSVVGQADFRGNNYGDYANGAGSSVGSQSAGVRQAYIGYDFAKSDNGAANVKLGRFIPNMVNQYGDDAMTGWFALSGYFPEDGVQLQYTGKIGSIDLTAQLSVVNSMQLWLFNGSAPSPDSNVRLFSMTGSGSAFKGGSSFNGNGGGAFGNDSNYSSNSSDKAYIAFLGANVDLGNNNTLELAADYGTKMNDVDSAGGDATQTPGSCTTNADGTQTCTSVTLTPNPATARDVQYMEASAGFNHQDMIKLGAWYSEALVGRHKTLTDDNGGATSFGNDYGNPDDFRIAGIGVQGNSKLWGMTDVLAKDGLVTFAAGAQMFMHRWGGLSDSDAAKNDVTMVSVGAGYTKGGFYTELNASYFTSENDVFANSGHNNYTNNAQQVYLVTGFSL